MTSTSASYRARAEQCAREARETRFENVRKRHLRSEAVWSAMAARLLHGERARLAAVAIKQDKPA